MNTQFWLLFLFGALLVGTIVCGWLAWRGAARKARVRRQVESFVSPRLMAVRRCQAPLYGDRSLSSRKGETPAEAYDRWLVSDEQTDYTKQ
jgi:hypothetical protein